MNKSKVYVMMLLATVFWSGAFIAGKYNAPYIPPFTLTFLRFAIATVVLYVVIKVMKVEFQLKKEHIPLFLVTGIVGMFGYHVFFFWTFKYTSAINASIIAASSPITTSIFVAIFMKQFVSKRQLAGIGISFLGVILTITGMNVNLLREFSLNIGDLFMLIATILWAIYSVFSKAKCNHIPPIIITFYSFLVCTIFVIPFSVYEKPWTFLPQAPMAAWISIVYMAIFPSVIGYLTQQYAIKEIGPTRASNFVNLIPIFSMILAIIILGEELVWAKVFTAIMIIFGVLLCQMEGSSRSDN
ncbi:MAG: DMT family transporter [Anaerovoracaceae bacterium]